MSAGRFLAPLKPYLCLTSSFYLESNLVFSVTSQRGTEWFAISSAKQTRCKRNRRTKERQLSVLQERGRVIIGNVKLFNI